METIFFKFSCQKKQIILIVETYFSTNASSRVLEADFLACTNQSFIYFSETPASERFFPSSRNVFLNGSFIPAVGKGFFSVETVYFEGLFPISETVTDMSEKQFLKTELILMSGN